MTGYWMWQDDYARECVPFLVRYAHRDRIAALPRAQVPSPGRYLRTHSAGQVWRRLSEGTGAKLAEWLLPAPARPGRPWRHLVPDRGVYLSALLALWLALAFGAACRRLPIARSGAAGALVLYHLGAAAFYVVLYGWYHPIGRGDRFLMSLYLPLALTLALGIERLRREHRSPAVNWATVAVYGWMFVGLAWRVAELVARPEFDPKHPL